MVLVSIYHPRERAKDELDTMKSGYMCRLLSITNELTYLEGEFMNGLSCKIENEESEETSKDT